VPCRSCLEKGATSERCARSPLQDLAEVDACPNFQAASPQVLKAFVYLAESDRARNPARRVSHVQLQQRRAAGLDQVLVGWLDPRRAAGGNALVQPARSARPGNARLALRRELQIAGHSPQRRSTTTTGVLQSGFEEALRTSNWAALEWWFYELPQLLNVAPPSRGAQLPFVPLQRVLLPGYLPDQAAQGEMVKYLLARGANPRQKLPFDPGRNVVGFAMSIRSPMLALLDEPAPTAAQPTQLARM
jgi:hypothetical protein